VKATPRVKRIHRKWWSGLPFCSVFFFWLVTARAEETTIEVLHYFGVQDQQQALNEVVTAFQHSNPDIKIRLTLIPFGELLSRTLQTAAVRQPPAVTALDNPDVLRAAKAGVLADIYPNLSQFPDWKNIYDEVKKVVSDGEHVFGIPIGSNSIALYYNKKMFAGAGIQEPPKTWNELVQLARRLTKAPVYGIAFPAINTEDCTGTWEAFLWSNHGSLLDLASDKAKQALKLWVDLVRNGYASRDVVTWSGGDVADQFISGRAAMMISGPWMLPTVKRSGLDYGIAPIPVLKAGERPVVALGGEVWCVMKNDKKIESAALKFIAFVQEPEHLLKLCETCNYVSSVRDVAQKEGKAQPDMLPFIEQMEAARARTSEGGASYPIVSQIARTAIQKALTGQDSIDSSLQNAAAEIEKLGLTKSITPAVSFRKTE
jgi:multiple sugar transport system substrate-binding protein